MQNVRTTHFNFFFTTFFTRSSAHGIDGSRLAATASTKVTARKTLNRAGATRAPDSTRERDQPCTYRSRWPLQLPLGLQRFGRRYEWNSVWPCRAGPQEA